MCSSCPHAGSNRVKAGSLVNDGRRSSGVSILFTASGLCSCAPPLLQCYRTLAFCHWMSA